MKFLVFMLSFLIVFQANALEISRTHPMHLPGTNFPSTENKAPTPNYSRKGAVIWAVDMTFIEWIQSLSLTAEQVDRNRKLSFMCGSSDFKPHIPRFLRAKFSDGYYELAFGDGYNLVDRKNVRSITKMYVFRHADATNCWVIEIRSPFLKPEYEKIQ